MQEVTRYGHLSVPMRTPGGMHYTINPGNDMRDSIANRIRALLSADAEADAGAAAREEGG